MEHGRQNGGEKQRKWAGNVKKMGAREGDGEEKRAAALCLIPSAET